MRIEKLSLSSELLVDFLRDNNHQLIYYTPKYLEFINSISDKIEVFYYCLFDNSNQIIALMPLAKKTNKEMEVVINSLPFFGSHGGFLYNPKVKDKSIIQRQLMETILDKLKNENILSFTVIENSFLPLDEFVFFDCGFDIIDSRLGQFKDFKELDDTLSTREAILKSCHTKTRNAIRKGLSYNPKISIREDHATLKWIQFLHEKSIKALNGKFKSLRVFESLLSAFPSPKHSRIFVGEINAKKVAALIVLLHENYTVEYFTPVIDEDYKHTQLLSALIYESMCILKDEGFSLWNWGGTWESQEGVYRFKERFGSFTLPYRYFSKIFDQSIKKKTRNELTKEFNYFYTIKYNS